MIKVGYPSRPRILAGIVPSRPSTAEPGASDKRTSGGGGATIHSVLNVLLPKIAGHPRDSGSLPALSALSLAQHRELQLFESRSVASHASLGCAQRARLRTTRLFRA